MVRPWAGEESGGTAGGGVGRLGAQTPTEGPAPPSVEPRDGARSFGDEGLSN